MGRCKSLVPSRHLIQLTMFVLMKPMVSKCSLPAVMEVSSFGIHKVKHKPLSWWQKVTRVKYLAVNGITSIRDRSSLHLLTKQLDYGMLTSFNRDQSKGLCMILRCMKRSGTLHTSPFLGRARVTRHAEFGIYAQVKMLKESMDTQTKSFQWTSTNMKTLLPRQAPTTRSNFGICEQLLTHRSWFWQDTNLQFVVLSSHHSMPTF